ncbi:MAG: hypothetical protein JWM19_837 [Actinomycetia bacterium]|nr:hypothetical protein [Actinomycetes bacterium]
MAESPTTLSYPLATPADQLNGGATFSTTTNTWVQNSGAVTLASPSTATRDPGGSQAECQLADGTSAGFTDTTYTLTAAQVAAGSLMGA